MKTKLLASVLALSALSTHVLADEVKVGLYTGLFTDHPFTERNDGQEWVEQNDMIGAEIRHGDWAFQITDFTNSFGNPGNTVGVEYTFFDIANFEFSIGGGVVTGYTQEENPLNFGNDAGLYGTVGVAYNYQVTKQFSIRPTIKTFGHAVTGLVGFNYAF